MKINANFNNRVVVHSQELQWVASPIAGVERRPLDRVGDEVARATTIVRYAPNSHFSPHVHTGGEEFLILEGVFQDEHGDYPAGAYVRNPPGTSHTPRSKQGCVMFVKLWQFDKQDQTQVSLRSDFMPAIPHRDIPDVKVIPLYKDNLEQVSILELAANALISLPVAGGAELLVLEGELLEGKDKLAQYSWLRLPVNSILTATAGQFGAKFWLKTGHLTAVEQQIKLLENNL